MRILKHTAFLSLLFLLPAACGISTPKPATRKPVQEQYVQRIADLPSGLRPQTLYCLNHSVCWVGDYLKQWRTDDGGLHWRLVYEGKPFESEIRTVNYVDERVAWIVTLRGVYKTEDSGHTWKMEAVPIPVQPHGEVTSVTFLKNSPKGWITGGVYRSMTDDEQRLGTPRTVSAPPDKLVLQPAIFFTQDAGKTWSRESLPAKIGRAYAPAFSMDNGFLITDFGTFYSSNLGRRWERTNFDVGCTDPKYLEGYDIKPAQVAFTDAQNAWLLFEDGRITRSSDGGRTWCDVVAPAKSESERAHFKQIHFLDIPNGFGLTAEGLLCRTTDGGKTWTHISENKYETMFFLDNGDGWLTAPQGFYRLSSN